MIKHNSPEIFYFRIKLHCVASTIK